MRRRCLDKVHQLARRDERVVFIGSDLGPGTLDAMRTEMPERFFMEGVTEQAMIGQAAGMALAGFIPYVNTIATFLTRRCLEQVALDLCLQGLPVRLIGNGGGVVYAPLGPTHLAIEDVALMRALPRMTVVAPADAEEMDRFMETTLDWPDPIYIRLAKGGDPVVTPIGDPFVIGQGVILREPAAVTFLAYGITTHRCLRAAELLAEQGVAAGVVHLPTLKPLDEDLLRAVAGHSRMLVTVEEHTAIGGLGSAVADLLTAPEAACHSAVLRRLALPDAWPHVYGSQEAQLDLAGMTPEAIATRVRTWWDTLVTEGTRS